MQYDYVHHDDTFSIAQNSGLEAVRMSGIDEVARQARHLRYIRENIALSQGGLPEVQRLWAQWATEDGLGL
jgi:hypothetical protein